MKLLRSFLKSLPLAAAGFFIFLIFSPPVLAAETIISSDTVWNAGEVKIFNEGDSLMIEPNATLTINGGTVLKMGKNTIIAVGGSLHLAGQAGNPVVITSLKDDEFGGDSNNDGNASLPAKGDWGGIIIDSTSTSAADWPEFSADYAAVKFAGGFQDNPFDYFQIVKAGSIRIDHSDILDNDGSFHIYNAASVSINHSNVYNPTQPQWYGYYLPITMISSDMPGILDVKNNYWGSPDGPTTLMDAYTGRFKGTFLYQGNFDYQPFASSAFPFLALPEKKLDPVILIPGMMGSAEVPTGNYLPNGKTEYAWALDPILRSYDNLWNALKLAGYKAGENLFAFPYDWRRSNVLTAVDLKTKIDEVKAKCHCSKVDLVAHSMGGLVARQYIESDAYAGDVDQLIFLATPHLGSPKAYMMWEAGEFGKEQSDWGMQRYLELMAAENLFIGKNAIFNYTRDYPVESVKELLPVYNYLADKGVGQSKSYPNSYPVNIFLENLNDPFKLAKLGEVRMTNIVVDDQKSDTPIGFQIVSSTDSMIWEYGMPYDFYKYFSANGVINGPGDDTVPAYSNQNFAGTEIDIVSNHEHIPTDAQKAVIKALTGKEPANEVRDWLVKNFFMVRIFSPADFQIIAPDGKIMGKDFANNKAINEIGGYYSGFDSDAEWAVIPNPIDGQYKINLKGTGEGPYRLSVSSISDATSTDHDFIGLISTGVDRSIDLQLDSTQFAPIVNIAASSSLESMLAEIVIGYDMGLIKDNKVKALLSADLKRIMAEVSLTQKAIDILRHAREQVAGNAKLNAVVKRALLGATDKLIERSQVELKKLLAKELDNFLKSIDKYVKQSKIDPVFYDIMNQDSQFITNNYQ